MIVPFQSRISDPKFPEKPELIQSWRNNDAMEVYKYLSPIY